MREYERYDEVQPAPRRNLPPIPPGPKPVSKRPRVNKAAVVLGDPVVVFGAFLRVFSRRRK